MESTVFPSLKKQIGTSEAVTKFEILAKSEATDENGIIHTGQKVVYLDEPPIIGFDYATEHLYSSFESL